jgi:DNA polymerase-3 subunit delta
MDFAQVLTKIEQGDIAPLYLFYGEERFLIERLVKKLRETLILPAQAEFTYYRFSGEEVDLTALCDLLNALPFFSARRLIILQNSDKLKKSVIEPLVAYCRDPMECNCFVCIAEKPNLKDPLYTAIARKGVIVHLRRLYRNQLGSWLEREATQLGYRLTPEASAYMVESGSEELAMLYSELLKVITYVGEKKTITLQEVSAVGGDEKMHSVFDLTEALARRHLGEGLKALDRLLAHGEPPLLLLRMITRQFRLLWQAMLYRRAGYSPEEIAKQIGLHRYFLRTLLPNSTHFTEEELHTIFQRLVQLDFLCKTTSIPPRRLLEKFVMDLCTFPLRGGRLSTE